MSDRSNYQQVGVEVDDQSFAHLTQKTNEATSSINRLSQANQGVADSAQLAGTRLQQAFSGVKGNIDDDINSIAAMRAQLTGAADDADKLGKRVNDNSGGEGAGVSGLRRSGAILNRVGLGAVGEPLMIAGEAQQLSKTFGGIFENMKAINALGDPLTEGLTKIAGAEGAVVVAGGLAVAALGAVVIAGAAFKATLDKGSEGLGNAVTYVDDYYKAIEKGTTESLQLQLKELQVQQVVNQEKEKTLQAAYDAAHPKPINDGSEGADIGAAFTAIISDLSAGGKQLNKDLEDTKKAVADNDIQQQALKAALNSTTVATNDAAESEKKLADVRAAAQKQDVQQIEAGAKREQELERLKTEGTVKQVQDRINANKSQIESDQNLIYRLQQIKSPTKETTDEIARLRAEFDQLTDENKKLTGSILESVQAREAETKRIKDSVQAEKDRVAALDKQQQAEVQIVQKMHDQINSIEDAAAQKRAEIAQKLNDALVKAAQDAVDASQKALDELEKAQSNNLLSLNRDLRKQERAAAATALDDRIKEQRQERDDLQAHLDALKQIRDRDAGRERDDLLNRNYRDLFALREQKTQDINTENGHFAEQQQQRRQALGDQLSDLQRSDVQQRNERLIAYKQANADALAQYETQLRDADQAKIKAIAIARKANQTELTDLTNATNQKLALTRAGAKAELQIAAQTEDVRRQIFNNMLAEAQQILGQTASSNNQLPVQRTGSRPVPVMDDGGSLRSFQSAIVQGARAPRESFNGMPFPPGMGLFIPFQSGSVNPKGGAKNVNLSFTIYDSNNPMRTRQEVLHVLEQAGLT